MEPGLVLLPRPNVVDSLSVSHLLVPAAPPQRFQLSESFQVRAHTRCAHSYLLTGADQPECTTCQCPLTDKHILVERTDFNDTRNKYFVASSMEELFRTVHVRNVFDFIKETNFYNRYAVTRREDRLSLQISSTVTSDAGTYVCGDLLTPTSTCAAVLGVLGTKMLSSEPPVWYGLLHYQSDVNIGTVKLLPFLILSFVIICIVNCFVLPNCITVDSNLQHASETMYVLTYLLCAHSVWMWVCLLVC